MKEKIVVVGFGWVGQANALALSQMHLDVSYYDPQEPVLHYGDALAYSSIPRLKTLFEKDSPSTWYVVCIGDRVSTEGVQDINSISSALMDLTKAKGGVILRSTVLPESLATLPFHYYVPEFLHENKAVEECLKPFYFVVGTGTQEHSSEPSFFNSWRLLAHKNFSGTYTEASFIKYLSNIWNAARIAFVNEYGSLIAEPSNPENLTSINRVIDFIFEKKEYVRYGRPFGGHCLPKDTRAFQAWYAKSDAHVELLTGICAANDIQRKRQEQYPLLPEWFSEWQRPLPSGRVAFKALMAALRRRLTHLVGVT